MRTYIVAMASLAVVGCSQSQTGCNSFEAILPIIVVVNAATGDAICDAKVVATASSDDALSPITLVAGVPHTNDAGPCEYGGLNTPGVYTLTVSKSGFQTATAPGATVATQSCNATNPPPQAQLVTVTLKPN